MSKMTTTKPSNPGGKAVEDTKSAITEAADATPIVPKRLAVTARRVFGRAMQADIVLPDPTWSLDQLQDYAIAQMSASDHDAAQVAMLSARSVVNHLMAGLALAAIREKLKLSKGWRSWLDKSGIKPPKANDLIAFAEKAHNRLDELDGLTLPQAKRVLGLLDEQGKRLPLNGSHRGETRPHKAGPRQLPSTSTPRPTSTSTPTDQEPAGDVEEPVVALQQPTPLSTSQAALTPRQQHLNEAGVPYDQPDIKPQPANVVSVNGVTWPPAARFDLDRLRAAVNAVGKLFDALDAGDIDLPDGAAILAAEGLANDLASIANTIKDKLPGGVKRLSYKGGEKTNPDGNESVVAAHPGGAAGDVGGKEINTATAGVAAR